MSPHRSSQLSPAASATPGDGAADPRPEPEPAPPEALRGARAGAASPNRAPGSSAASGPPAPDGTAPSSLTGRRPRVTPEQLVAEMVPPPRFDGVRFDTYIPDPAQPSQTAAVSLLESFAAGIGSAAGGGSGRRRWFGRRASSGGGPGTGPSGVYLDGGYGVGKTHLLASLWHAAPVPPERKSFGTFVELTNLVGALGFQRAVAELSQRRLLCIDEFELDDPGDTVLVSSLLRRLAEAGVKLAATSNTLPDRLGEGRFAAADFLREIQGLAAQFTAVRIDGQDYRHRGLPDAPEPLTDAAVARAAHRVPGAVLDDFPALLEHLSAVHPSRYGALLQDVAAVGLRGVTQIGDQATALRMVVLADRMYDRELPVAASGVPFDALFTPEMLAGGYRKKYLRAVSRLVALGRDGAALAASS